MRGVVTDTKDWWIRFSLGVNSLVQTMPSNEFARLSCGLCSSDRFPSSSSDSCCETARLGRLGVPWLSTLFYRFWSSDRSERVCLRLRLCLGWITISASSVIEWHSVSNRCARLIRRRSLGSRVSGTAIGLSSLTMSFNSTYPLLERDDEPDSSATGYWISH